MKTKEIGDYGERLAIGYLRRRFYRILERNYSSKHGEIDIIAKKKKRIVFIEVKTRRDCPESIKRYGRAAAAVNYEKRQHIRYAVKDYLRRNNTSLSPRIDIIEVYFSPDNIRKHRIVHIENAFGEKG
ncbi:MAG: YraN family protein [Ruminococcaceae bacterium]|nr:YraN family protein [Oscillospiraceae bacterium]